MEKKFKIVNFSVVDVDFKCPKCNFQYYEKDYYKQLHNSRKFLIYKKCKGCDNKIGITTDYTGNVKIWIKENEKDFKNI